MAGHEVRVVLGFVVFLVAWGGTFDMALVESTYTSDHVRRHLHVSLQLRILLLQQ